LRFEPVEVRVDQRKIIDPLGRLQLMPPNPNLNALDRGLGAELVDLGEVLRK
jgi:hypothetical protein